MSKEGESCTESNRYIAETRCNENMRGEEDFEWREFFGVEKGVKIIIAAWNKNCKHQVVVEEVKVNRVVRRDSNNRTE